MQVKDIMSTHLACCTPETSVPEIARMMIQCDCGSIPVVDDDMVPLGIVTDRDITCRIVARNLEPREFAAEDVMSSPLVVVSPESTIEECCAVMELNQVRRVVVVDETGGCVGIVALGDIAQVGPDWEACEVVRDVSLPNPSPSRVTIL